MRFSLSRIKWCSLLAVGLLLGCGGGGGGGGTPSVTLSLDASTVTFAGTYDDTQAPAPQQVSGSVANATSTIYLQVLYTNHALANTTVALTGTTTGEITLFPKLPSLIGPGTFTDTVQVKASLDSAGTQQIAGSPQTITVTYTVAPKLLASGHSLVFNQVEGTSPAADQSVNLSGITSAWQATGNQSWIKVRTPTGTGASTLSLGVDATGLAPGSYTGAVTVAETGSSDTAVIGMQLTVIASALLADVNGVAFASMPGLSLTTRTLNLRDSFGQSTAWTATSSQGWLTVTPSGTTPCSLTLTADPRGLPANSLQSATVTLTGAPSYETPEVIQVGLWVGATAPATVHLSTFCTNLILDPVRPYAYTHKGGPDLTVYNLYTGAVVKTLASVGTTLGSMALSSDGAHLYLQDTTTGKVIPMALPTFDLGQPWPLGSEGASDMAFCRFDGLPLLLTSSGHAYDPGSGSDYGAIFPTSYGISTLGVSQDGTRFVLQEKGISPSRFSVFSLAFSPNNGGTLSAVCVASGSGGSNGTDAVLNRDGSRVYTACGSPYDFGVFDGATGSNLMTLPGDAYPNNVEVAWDGRLIAGANVSYGPSDIWIYSESGALLSRLKASGYACNILPGQLRVSADGLRLAVLTSDPSLQFITIP